MSASEGMNDALWTYARLIHGYHDALIRKMSELADARRKVAELTELIPKLEQQVETQRRYVAEMVDAIGTEHAKVSPHDPR